MLCLTLASELVELGNPNVLCFGVVCLQHDLPVLELHREDESFGLGRGRVDASDGEKVESSFLHGHGGVCVVAEFYCEGVEGILLTQHKPSFLPCLDQEVGRGREKEKDGEEEGEKEREREGER